MTEPIVTTRSSDNQAAATLADRWLLLGAYGPQARFHMAAAWIALAGLASVDTVWLLLSRLSFAANNWDSVIVWYCPSPSHSVFADLFRID